MERMKELTFSPRLNTSYVSKRERLPVEASILEREAARRMEVQRLALEQRLREEAELTFHPIISERAAKRVAEKPCFERLFEEHREMVKHRGELRDKFEAEERLQSNAHNPRVAADDFFARNEAARAKREEQRAKAPSIGDDLYLRAKEHARRQQDRDAAYEAELLRRAGGGVIRKVRPYVAGPRPFAASASTSASKTKAATKERDGAPAREGRADDDGATLAGSVAAEPASDALPDATGEAVADQTSGARVDDEVLTASPSRGIPSSPTKTTMRTTSRPARGAHPVAKKTTTTASPGSPASPGFSSSSPARALPAVAPPEARVETVVIDDRDEARKAHLSRLLQRPASSSSAATGTSAAATAPATSAATSSAAAAATTVASSSRSSTSSPRRRPTTTGGAPTSASAQAVRDRVAQERKAARRAQAAAAAAELRHAKEMVRQMVEALARAKEADLEHLSQSATSDEERALAERLAASLEAARGQLDREVAVEELQREATARVVSRLRDAHERRRTTRPKGAVPWHELSRSLDSFSDEETEGGGGGGGSGRGGRGGRSGGGDAAGRARDDRGREALLGGESQDRWADVSGEAGRVEGAGGEGGAASEEGAGARPGESGPDTAVGATVSSSSIARSPASKAMARRPAAAAVRSRKEVLDYIDYRIADWIERREVYRRVYEEKQSRVDEEAVFAPRINKVPRYLRGQGRGRPAGAPRIDHAQPGVRLRPVVAPPRRRAAKEGAAGQSGASATPGVDDSTPYSEPDLEGGAGFGYAEVEGEGDEHAREFAAPSSSDRGVDDGGDEFGNDSGDEFGNDAGAVFTFNEVEGLDDAPTATAPAMADTEGKSDTRDPRDRHVRVALSSGAIDHEDGRVDLGHPGHNEGAAEADGNEEDDASSGPSELAPPPRGYDAAVRRLRGAVEFRMELRKREQDLELRRYEAGPAATSSRGAGARGVQRGAGRSGAPSTIASATEAVLPADFATPANVASSAAVPAPTLAAPPPPSAVAYAVRLATHGAHPPTVLTPSRPASTATPPAVPNPAAATSGLDDSLLEALELRMAGLSAPAAAPSSSTPSAPRIPLVQVDLEPPRRISGVSVASALGARLGESPRHVTTPSATAEGVPSATSTPAAGAVSAARRGSVPSVAVLSVGEGSYRSTFLRQQRVRAADAPSERPAEASASGASAVRSLAGDSEGRGASTASPAGPVRSLGVPVHAPSSAFDPPIAPLTPRFGGRGSIVESAQRAATGEAFPPFGSVGGSSDRQNKYVREGLYFPPALSSDLHRTLFAPDTTGSGSGSTSGSSTGGGAGGSDGAGVPSGAVAGGRRGSGGVGLGGDNARSLPASLGFAFGASPVTSSPAVLGTTFAERAARASLSSAPGDGSPGRSGAVSTSVASAAPSVASGGSEGGTGWELRSPDASQIRSLADRLRALRAQ